MYLCICSLKEVHIVFAVAGMFLKVCFIPESTKTFQEEGLASQGVVCIVNWKWESWWASWYPENHTAYDAGSLLCTLNRLVKIRAIVPWRYGCPFLKAVSLGWFYCWLQSCVVSFACCLESGLSMIRVSESLPEASVGWCCWCTLTIWNPLFYSLAMS